MAACAISLTSGMPRGALLPVIGDFWQISGQPDLGALNAPGQQPVDFAIWQAGDALTDVSWQPIGIAAHSDPAVGEPLGGLQAPFVFRTGEQFNMLYGDWDHIDRMVSPDGVNFTRVIQRDGTTAMFDEGGPTSNTRDPMVLLVNGTFFAYYTANPNNLGGDYVRTSADLAVWSDSTLVAAGGAAGTGPYSAECPHVVARDGGFYLFRTQHYGANATTSVYYSQNPYSFGVGDGANSTFVTTLPVAAPEVLRGASGEWYIAALLPSLTGIHVAPLTWV